MVKKRIKNPNVATDFLPDRDREANEKKRREELREQWEEEQVVGGESAFSVFLFVSSYSIAIAFNLDSLFFSL
jgi:hypothetical protein